MCLSYDAGDRQDITIRNAALVDGAIKVQRLLAPGLEGTNIVLSPDLQAGPQMRGGYRWSGAALNPAVGGGKSKVPSWPIAVAVVVGALFATIVGVCLLAAWRRKQRQRKQQSQAEKGPCPNCQEDPCLCSEVRHTVMPLNQQLPQELLGDLEGLVIVPHRIIGDAPAAQQGSSSLVGLSKATQELSSSVRDSGPGPAGFSQLPGTSNSHSGSANVSAGLNNWWRAVSSTMLTLMQRRLDAGGSSEPGGGSSSGDGGKQQVVGVVSLQEAARAGGVLPLAGLGRAAGVVVLEDVLGRVRCALGNMVESELYAVSKQRPDMCRTCCSGFCLIRSTCKDIVEWQGFVFG
jgi:hypothetical protein